MASSEEGGSLVDRNVQAIVELQNAEEFALSHQQKFLERAVSFIVKPAFFYLEVSLILGWIILNLVLAHQGARPLDGPYFPGLLGVITVVALLLTTTVVITQNRQGYADQIRSHLDIQVSLIVDQKVAKVISLLEEMRRDLPNVQDRVDEEAEQLTQNVDPAEVANIIATKLSETVSDMVDAEPQ